MKKLILIFALFGTAFPSIALNQNYKHIIFEPWHLVLEENEAIYTIQNVSKTDSGFLAITQSDTLFYKQEPNLRCNQVIIINTDTMRCDNLYRNEDVTILLLVVGGIFLVLWILSVLTIIMIRKE